MYTIHAKCIHTCTCTDTHAHTHLCSAFIVESEHKFSLSALTLTDQILARPCLSLDQYELCGVGSRNHPVEPRILHEVSQVSCILVSYGPGGVGVSRLRGQAGRKVLRVVNLDKDAVVLGRLVGFKGRGSDAGGGRGCAEWAGLGVNRLHVRLAEKAVVARLGVELGRTG